MMRYTLTLLITCIVITIPAVEQGPFEVVKVVTGDTIIVKTDNGEQTVRILYVDTPEIVDNEDGKAMPEGKAAQAWLAKFLSDKKVKLWGPGETFAKDKRQRLLADPLFYEQSKKYTNEKDGIKVELGEFVWSSVAVEIVGKGHSPYWRKNGDATKVKHVLLDINHKLAKEVEDGVWKSNPKWMKDKANERPVKSIKKVVKAGTAQAEIEMPAPNNDSFLHKLDGYSEFLKAVRMQDVKSIKKRLNEDPSVVDTTGHMGRTALHIAAEKGNVEIIKLLLANKADVNCKRGRGDTAIYWAKNAATAEALIKGGANIHIRDFSKREPIHWAAQFTRPDVIEVLLKHGANIEVTDDNGHTPLHWAAQATYFIHHCSHTNLETIDCIKLLIDKGANVNAQSKLGNVPLHGVAPMPDMNQKMLDGSLKYSKEIPLMLVKCIQLLKTNGAKADVKNKDGLTPLDFSSGLTKLALELKANRQLPTDINLLESAIIYLSSNDKLQYINKEIDLEDIPKQVKMKSVLIVADPKTRFNYAKKVVDYLKSNGFSPVKLVTKEDSK